MPILKVQLNHPGSQKSHRFGSGYSKNGVNTIREWNNDISHYRKFILNSGVFLDNALDRKPKEVDLYFWGEWEGNSCFNPINNSDYRVLPNGIHRPFHSIAIKGVQNTDPYVFGENFKYCICKQKGKLLNLCRGSIILFGSVFPSLNKFYIDTVFVVKNHTPSKSVQANGGLGYSQTYKEETLEQLTQYLKIPQINSNNSIYHSQTWWDDNEFFSFVPCKLEVNGNGFERLFINLNDPITNPSSYPSGISYFNSCKLTPKELWNKITVIAIEQKFKLGIRFTEP
jgi:hypothetical protein